MARILVIDDEPQMRSLIETFLTHDGHEVDQAENGALGLRLAAVRPYDLVITDVLMPETDGIEVTIALKSKYPGTKIIIMTGGSPLNGKDYLVRGCQLMNVDLVIPKPLAIAELRTAVQKMFYAE